MQHPFTFEIETFEFQPNFEPEYIGLDSQREFDSAMEALDNEIDIPENQELLEEMGDFDTKFADFEWEGEVNRSSSDYIRWVQQSLNRILGLRLAVDGVMGPLTRNAIRTFQQRKGLAADGVLGPQTEQSMIAAGAGSPPGGGTAGRVITLPPVVIVVPGFVLDRFAFNQVGIQPFHDSILKRIAERIHQSTRSSQPIRTIRLVGHTDPAGTDSYNLSLGKRRSLAVRQQLMRMIEQKAPGLSRRVLILVSSKGEKEPVDSNNTEQGRALNRRVDVFLSTRSLQPRPQPLPMPIVPPVPLVVEPPSPSGPVQPTCDRTGLERGVNACIGDARKCLIDAHKKLAAALIQCRMHPGCNVGATASYYLALRRCREALLACDQRVKRETRCT